MPTFVTTNYKSVTVDGLRAGIINDVWLNYSASQAAITTAYNASIPSPALTKYPYLLAGYQSGISVTLPTLNQALQNWFGRSGVDAASYIYTPTYVSMKGVKRLIITGDSLGVGIGGTSYQTVPGGTDFPTVLCEGNANWAQVARVNQSHGSVPIGPSNVNSLLQKYTAEIQPYRPVGTERGILLMWTGATDFYQALRTGAAVITDTTTYVTMAHADGFYVVLCKQPQPYKAGGSGGDPNGYWTPTVKTGFDYFNTNIASCGADLIVDLPTTMSLVSGYWNSANLPHPNDAGYAVAAGLVNTALSNP